MGVWWWGVGNARQAVKWVFQTGSRELGKVVRELNRLLSFVLLVSVPRLVQEWSR